MISNSAKYALNLFDSFRNLEPKYLNFGSLKGNICKYCCSFRYVYHAVFPTSRRAATVVLEVFLCVQLTLCLPCHFVCRPNYFSYCMSKFALAFATQWYKILDLAFLRICVGLGVWQLFEHVYNRSLLSDTSRFCLI